MYRKGTDTLGFAAGGINVFEVLTDKVRVSGSTHVSGRMYIETMDEFVYNGTPDRIVIWKGPGGTPGTDKGELEFISGCTIQKTTCPDKKKKKPWWKRFGNIDYLLEKDNSYYDDDVSVEGPFFSSSTLGDTVEQITGRTNAGNVNVFGGLYQGGTSAIVQDSNNGKIQGGTSIFGIGAASLAAGTLVYQSTTTGSGGLAEFTRWTTVLADSPTTSSGLLGICLSATTSADDTTYVALDGFVTIDEALIDNRSTPYTDDRGKPVYISAANQGNFSMTPPTGSGEVVRIVGHVVNNTSGAGAAYLIRFNPDNTWIEL
jgi:hypothetical protein